MSNGKRPEKQPDKAMSQMPISKDNGSEQASSLLGRVGASASGLMQDFAGRSAPNSVSSDLASLHASASKGESSSSTREGNTLASQEGLAWIQSRQNGSHSSVYTETFRSTPLQTTATAQESFDRWSRAPESFAGGDHKSSDMLDNPNGQSPFSAEKTPPSTTFQTNRGRQYGEIVESDGAAVSSLLSEPNLNMEDVPSDTWHPTEESGEPEGNWLIDQNNSERQATASTTSSAFQGQSLGPNELHGSNNNQQTNQYGLIPNLWNPKLGSMTTNMDDSQGDEIKREISIADQQIQPWLAILDRYQDEVWGDMLPLVQEAREEVKRAHENKDQLPTDSMVGPAVRRLQMVLQHIDSSKGSR